MPNKTKLDERWDLARQDIIEAARSADVDIGIMVKISERTRWHTLPSIIHGRI